MMIITKLKHVRVLGVFYACILLQLNNSQLILAKTMQREFYVVECEIRLE